MTFLPGPIYSAESGQAAPLPVIQFIHYPSNYAASPNILLGTPWVSPIRGGYNNSLHAPPPFPNFQQGGVRYPPEPGSAVVNVSAAWMCHEHDI